jgi:hypothetical protein
VDAHFPLSKFDGSSTPINGPTCRVQEPRLTISCRDSLYNDGSIRSFCQVVKVNIDFLGFLRDHQIWQDIAHHHKTAYAGGLGDIDARKGIGRDKTGT